MNRLHIRSLLGIVLVQIWISVSHGSERVEMVFPTMVKAIYGFSSEQKPFSTMNPSQYPEWLKAHGINAVFVGPTEKSAILKILNDAGILCLQKLAVFTGRSLYRSHPSWRPIMKDGHPFKPDGWYHGLSPNQPELRQRRLDEFRRRMSNQWIQGIWLDFIRYAVRWDTPHPTLIDTCFSDESLEQFERFAGIDLSKYPSVSQKADFILRHHQPRWIEFKVETIRSWVEEAQRLRDAFRPELLLGLFGIPWTPDEMDGAIRRIAGQDFSALSPHIDVFSPMVYHRLCGKSPEWVVEVTRSIQEQTQKTVWPIVQAVSEPTHLPPGEFRAVIHEAAEASGKGILLFAAHHIENEQRWKDVQIVFDRIDR